MNNPNNRDVVCPDPGVPAQWLLLPPCWSCLLAPGFHSDKVPRSEAPRYTAKGRNNQEKKNNE